MPLSIAHKDRLTLRGEIVIYRRDHDARLSRRYADLMTRSTDLLVNREGYVLAGSASAQSKPLDIPEGGGEPGGPGAAKLEWDAGPAQAAREKCEDMI